MLANVDPIFTAMYFMLTRRLASVSY